jgi:hypothetical protein
MEERDDDLVQPAAAYTDPDGSPETGVTGGQATVRPEEAAEARAGDDRDAAPANPDSLVEENRVGDGSELEQDPMISDGSVPADADIRPLETEDEEGSEPGAK